MKTGPSDRDGCGRVAGRPLKAPFNPGSEGLGRSDIGGGGAWQRKKLGGENASLSQSRKEISDLTVQ